MCLYLSGKNDVIEADFLVITGEAVDRSISYLFFNRMLDMYRFNFIV